MVNLERFSISDEIKEKMQDEKYIASQIQEGILLQDIFGFTNEVMAEFYDAAKNILEKDRFEDAIDAFVFLTTLNPFVADFWIGLGMSQQRNNEHTGALEAYRFAFGIDGRDIFPYILAAQCCMDIHDFEQAIIELEGAEQFAKENPKEETSEQLKQDALAAKQYILEQKQKVGV